MAEVHIEFSSRVSFAPFNGGYPEHAAHLQAANLDTTHNLWYDIYDHNDPQKTRLNWSLISETEHEQAWFPNGEVCEPAILKTSPGSVAQSQNENMQSFSLQQMIQDAQKQHQTESVCLNPIPPPPPAVDGCVSKELEKFVQTVASAEYFSVITIYNCITAFLNFLFL